MTMVSMGWHNEGRLLEKMIQCDVKVINNNNSKNEIERKT